MSSVSIDISYLLLNLSILGDPSRTDTIPKQKRVTAIMCHVYGGFVPICVMICAALLQLQLCTQKSVPGLMWTDTYGTH